MRFVLVIFVSVALLVSARAQSPTQPQLPSDPPPGTGQEITIDDLQGFTISGVIQHVGRTRWSGDNIVRGPIQYRWRFTIIQIGGSGGAVKWNNDVSVRIGNDKWYTTHYSLSEIIGRPNTQPEVSGARAVVVTFEDSTLTILRVFDKGGRITKIMFSRAGPNIVCTATALFLNEAGARNPTVRAPILGGYREYIGMKQTSSTCHVSKN